MAVRVDNMLWRKILILIMVACLSVLACCDRNYSKPLPNGYAIVKPDSATICIASPTSGLHHPSHHGGGVAVAAFIDQLGVTGDIVYGHVASSSNSSMSDIEGPGYFVLDTRTGELRSRMSYEQFKISISSRGLTDISMQSPDKY